MRYRRFAAATTIAALLAGAAGCGGGGGEETAQSQATPTPTAEPEPTAAPTGLQPVEQADAYAGLRKATAQLAEVTGRIALGSTAGEDGRPNGPAATYRTSLTYALTEHVYLIGIAAQTAVAKSETSQVVKAALDALEANSALVVEVLGGAMEDADREEFRTGWLAFTRSFYDYAVAVKDDDSAKRGEAENVMAEYRVELAAFLTTVTDGNVPQYITKRAMKDHIYVLTNALDAIATEDPAGFDLLREAAASVEQTALAFTKGFQPDAEDVGELEEQGPTVRAKLGGLTVQHAYLAAMSYVTAYTDAKRFSGPAYNQAKVAIDDNAKAIGEIVKEVTTSAQQAKFLEEWRRTIGDLEDYAEGAYFDSQRVRDGALDFLDKDTKTAGRFFDRLTKGRDADDFTAKMARHLASFTGMIDALKTGFARTRS